MQTGSLDITHHQSSSWCFLQGFINFHASKIHSSQYGKTIEKHVLESQFLSECADQTICSAYMYGGSLWLVEAKRNIS